MKLLRDIPGEPGKRLLSVSQVADILGVSPEAVECFVEIGDLAGSKDADGQVWILEHDLNHSLAKLKPDGPWDRGGVEDPPDKPN